MCLTEYHTLRDVFSIILSDESVTLYYVLIDLDSSSSPKITSKKSDPNYTWELVQTLEITGVKEGN